MLGATPEPPRNLRVDSMAAPEFVQEAETAWNTTTSPKVTSSFDVQTDDVLVVFAGAENGNVDLADPAGGSLTWVDGPAQDISEQQSVAMMWSATVDSSKSMTVTFTRTAGTERFGGNVLTFRSSGGIGATASTNNGTGSGAPSLNITTTRDNSAIVMLVVDWNAVSGASRTYRQVNGANPVEVTFDNSGAGSTYVMYGAYYADAGPAGLKTVGLTAPSNQRYVIVAVEVLGTEGGGGGTVNTETLTDGLGMQDAFLARRLRQREGLDGIGVFEGSPIVYRQFNLQSSDAFSVIDAATWRHVRFAVASSLIGVAEEFLSQFRLTRSIDEGLVIGDDFSSSVIGQNVFLRITEDSISVAMDAMTSYELNRLHQSVTAMDSLSDMRRFRTRAVSSLVESASEVAKVMLLVRLLDSGNEIIDSLQSVIATAVLTDGSKIRIGVDQPNILLGRGMPAIQIGGGRLH